jgi:hypothetical protein
MGEPGSGGSPSTRAAKRSPGDVMFCVPLPPVRPPFEESGVAVLLFAMSSC